MRDGLAFDRSSDTKSGERWTPGVGHEFLERADGYPA